MPFVSHDHVIAALRRKVPIIRWAMALAWGARTEVRTVVIPMRAALAMKSPP